MTKQSAMIIAAMGSKAQIGQVVEALDALYLAVREADTELEALKSSRSEVKA